MGEVRLQDAAVEYAADGAAARVDHAGPAAVRSLAHGTATANSTSGIMAQCDATATWGGAELAAMAAAWDAEAIDRCIIQAHYAQYGYIDEDELGWLHIPDDWPRACAPAHTQEKVPNGDAAMHAVAGAKQSGCVHAPTNAGLMQAPTPSLVGRPGLCGTSAYGGPSAAHTPTELYSDVEEGDAAHHAARGGGCELAYGAEMERRPTDSLGGAPEMDGPWPHGSTAHGGAETRTGNVEDMPNAYAAATNAAVDTSGVALDGSSISGAPSRVGNGTALHPDALCSSAAFWACLGDPSDALAWGGA